MFFHKKKGKKIEQGLNQHTLAQESDALDPLAIGAYMLLGPVVTYKYTL